MLKVDRCFDKNAKFYFKIHLIPLKENAHVITKVPFSRQNAPDLLGHTPDFLQIRKRYRIIKPILNNRKVVQAQISIN